MKRIYLPGIVFFSDLFASGLPSARSVLCPGSVLPERSRPSARLRAARAVRSSSLRSAAHATADSVPGHAERYAPAGAILPVASATPSTAGCRVPSFAPGPFRSSGPFFVPAAIPPERPYPSSRGMRSGTPLPGLSFPSLRPPRQPLVAGSRPSHRAPSAHTAADGHAVRMPRDCSHVNCFYRPMRGGVTGRFCVMWRPGDSRAQGGLLLRCILLIFKFLHCDENGNILLLNGKKRAGCTGYT